MARGWADQGKARNGPGRVAECVAHGTQEELIAEVFPDMPVTRALGEHDTSSSVDKARRVLGYHPQHSWR